MKCVLKYGCQEGGQCEAFDECYYASRTVTTEQVAEAVGRPRCPSTQDDCISPHWCMANSECGHGGSPFINPNGSPRHSVEPYIVKVCCERHFNCADPSFPCTPRQKALAASAEMACADIEPKAGDNGGLRYNSDKPEYEQIPPEALEALAWHYTQAGGPRGGPTKYPARNWERGMAMLKCFGCLMRHSWKWMRGEDNDPETGSHHMIAVAWNAFAIYTYAVRGIGVDDRPLKSGSMK